MMKRAELHAKCAPGPKNIGEKSGKGGVKGSGTPLEMESEQR